MNTVETYQNAMVGRAESGRGQRHHRRGQGGLFPTDQPDRIPGLSKQPAVQPLHRSDEGLAVRLPGDTTDLYRRSTPIECAIGQSPTTGCVNPVRAGDPNGVPRGFGCADSVSQGEGDSHATGTAGDHTTGPSASRLHEIPRRS